MKQFYIFLVAIFISGLGFGQTVLLNESFETDGQGDRYVSSLEFRRGPNDHWMRTDGVNISNVTAPYSNSEGSFFWAAEDTDDTGGNGNDEQTLDITGISIANFTSLTFSGLFGAGNEGGPGMSSYDSTDFIKVTYQIDGGGYQNLLWFSQQNNDSTNEPIGLDANFDGQQDGALLGNTLQLFTASIGPIGDILDLRITVHMDSENEEIAFDNLEISGTFSGLVYKDNNWTPSPPDNTTGGLDALIVNGVYTLPGDVALNNLFVNPGAAVVVPSGITLTTTAITLESNSRLYSSLILDGNIVGTVNYKRFVNEDGSGATGGNDLISAPLSDQSWSDFLLTGTNATDLLNNGGTPIVYGFAPFDKNAPTPDFINYDGDTVATLSSGKGYRTATDNGTTLTFTGIPLSGPGNVPVNIEYTGASFTAWNLIGNPYPSYIDMEAFLNTDAGPGVKNIDIIDANSGIYGYDGNVSDGWKVFTLANATGKLIAPGQGFFIAADPADVDDYDIQFNPNIRRVGSIGQLDDFIENRASSNLTYLELRASTANDAYITDFYFNDNATSGLDAGYDAIIFGGAPPAAFALYSLLVDGSNGEAISLQALNTTDVNNITIPLGLNSNQGEQLTFSINEASLPSSIEVYLEDNVTNTSTLLNSGDYTLTPSTALNGSGRFFLRFTDSFLSTSENTLKRLSVYTNQNNREIIITGQIESRTKANIYDMQGRLVTSKLLDINTPSQSIEVNSLTSGIYIVQMESIDFKRSIKILLK